MCCYSQLLSEDTHLMLYCSFNLPISIIFFYLENLVFKTEDVNIIKIQYSFKMLYWGCSSSLLPSMVYYRLKTVNCLTSYTIIWNICVNILKYALLHSWNKDYDVLVYDGSWSKDSQKVVTNFFA